jgi:GDP-mannose pyrophosphatase NudK
LRERVRVVSEQLLSDNWGTLTKYNLEFQRRDGQWQPQVREVYDRGNAAVILLCDPERRTVVLTRQFRFPIYVNGEDPGSIEACAGLLDGDDPEACARKEAEEESGYRVGTITHLFDSYMSPGSVTEKLSFFIGTYDPSHRVSDGGGLVDEGEDIAMAMVASGDIADAKTIMLLQHAALSGVFRR